MTWSAAGIPSRTASSTWAMRPGLGLELDERAIAEHPYVAHAFPSLWDGDWQTNFTQDRRD